MVKVEFGNLTEEVRIPVPTFAHFFVFRLCWRRDEMSSMSHNLASVDYPATAALCPSNIRSLSATTTRSASTQKQHSTLSPPSIVSYLDQC